MEGDPVGVIQAKADHVAVVKRPALHADAVHEDAVALAAVFDVEDAVFLHDGAATARDAGVFEDQVIAGLRAATEQERIVGNGHELRQCAGPCYFKNYFRNVRRG